jgi:hypothetical protein
MTVKSIITENAGLLESGEVSTTKNVTNKPEGLPMNSGMKAKEVAGDDKERAKKGKPIESQSKPLMGSEIKEGDKKGSVSGNDKGKSKESEYEDYDYSKCRVLVASFDILKGEIDVKKKIKSPRPVQDVIDVIIIPIETMFRHKLV